VPERPLFCYELPSGISALLTAKPLQDIIEVAADGGDRGVLGAEAGLADLQGPAPPPGLDPAMVSTRASIGMAHHLPAATTDQLPERRQ
jgi:hypothetical protein